MGTIGIEWLECRFLLGFECVFLVGGGLRLKEILILVVDEIGEARGVERVGLGVLRKHDSIILGSEECINRRLLIKLVALYYLERIFHVFIQ